MTSRTRSTLPTGRTMLIAGILLIAANLRAPITGIAPLLDRIRETFSLGTGEVGAITTLPLLVFAAASPFCVLLARRCGLERSLFIALVLTASGILLRSMGSQSALFIGTGVIGIGIAIANVLLPSLVKRDFPHSIPTVTGAYALMAGVVASIASVSAVPIADIAGSGWNVSLGCLLIVPMAALLVWVPQLSKHTAPAVATSTPPHGGKIWHSALAWQVTCFLGLNSLVYYVVVTWLPAILTQAGYSSSAAGALHGVSQVATAVPGLFFGALVGRVKDQRILAFAVAMVTAVSLVGFFVLPTLAILWSALFGFGTGAAFILGLSFISLRASSPRQAAALSGMVQSVGYLAAAGAPPAIGYLHDISGSWRLPLLTCVIACGLMALAGFGAGRATHIADPG